jgi:hypothetical protein
LVDRKLKLLKRDSSFTPELFKQRLEEKRENWERDLVMLVPKAPDFAQVKNQILEAITK